MTLVGGWIDFSSSSPGWGGWVDGCSYLVVGDSLQSVKIKVRSAAEEKLELLGMEELEGSTAANLEETGAEGIKVRRDAIV